MNPSRVLLIQADTDERRQTADLLAGTFDLVEVTDDNDLGALCQLVERERFDCAIVPSRLGPHTAERIVEAIRAAAPATPVVVLAASRRPGSSTEPEKRGFDFVLPHPEDVGQLPDLLAAVVQSSVTAQQNLRLEQEVARRDRVCLALAQAADMLLRSHSPQTVLPALLANVAGSMELSHVAYFDIERTAEGVVAARLVHQWPAPPAGDWRHPIAFDLARLPRWQGELVQQRAVGGPVTALPAEERQAFAPHGIRSVTAIPVIVGGVWQGVLRCEDHFNDQRFEGAEQHALRMVASMLGSFLERLQIERELTSAKEKLERTIAERTAELIATSDLLLAENTERLRAEQALRESQYRCLLATAANVGVWDWDLVNDVLYFDPAGCAPPDAPSPAADHEQRQLELALRAGCDRIGQMPAGQLFERCIPRSDGSVRWYQFRARPIFNAEHTLVRMVGTYCDVTDRKRVEETMRRAERLASVGTLAAGIAHEINNPIGAVLLAADFALGCLETPLDLAGAKQAIRDIVADAERCGEIVSGILRFAKNESTERRSTSLNEVVRAATSLCRAYAAEQKVDLLFDSEPDLPDVLLNETEIRQALVNVLRNAIESGADRVLVATRRAAPTHAGCPAYNKKTVAVSIQDNGCGIGESELGHLFDPFHTTRRETGGTGLGLSLVHSIISSHGGTIDVRSAVGHGTTVVIDLPQAGETDDEGAGGR